MTIQSSRTIRGWALSAIALVGALSLALIAPGLVHAAAPQVSNVTATSADPGSIAFRARVATDGDIDSVVLNWKNKNPDGDVSGSIRVEASGRTADVTTTLQTNTNDRYLPVGSQLTYSWSVTEKSGATTASPEQQMLFMDGRYQWQTKQLGTVTIYWYADAKNADDVLKATADSIASNEALLKVKLPYPVRVLLWKNSAEGKAAQRQRAATFDQQVITGGTRVSADLLHVYDALGEGLVDVARHEAAHIVTKVAGDGKVATMPSWLDEGTAVYAQIDPGRGYQGDLRTAIQGNRLLRLRNMAAASNNPNDVNLFYGQSWAVVKFMVDTYGKDKFAAIFRSLKDEDLPIDEAMHKHIGVDQDGLYNAYRKSVNLAVIDFPPVPKATGAAGAQATRPPLGIPTSVTSAENTSGPSGGGDSATSAAVSPTTAIVVGVIAVVLAGALGFGAFALSRKK